MGYRAVLLALASSIFISCATSEERRVYREGLQQMQYVHANDTAQCNAIAQCRYIKDLICFTKNPNRNKSRCEVDFKRSTIKAGGDTFLLQLNETNLRLGTYTAIGQAYDCRVTTNQVKSVNHVPNRHFDVRVISEAARSNCGVPDTCKPVKAINCRSRRGNPVRRCDTYVREHTIGAGGNTFIIEEKGFYARNRGYILNGMAYNCPIAL